MIAAPIPEDEQSRLEALHALLVLDTPPEERFDRIVAFAAREFQVPIALVSLVDGERQWFKGRVGLDLCETPRDVSFCGHTILQEGLLVVEDALHDPRFHDNPLVTDGPGIRFYAGVPLTLPCGHRIGSLCIIDSEPREFDAFDRKILRSLRDLVVQELTQPVPGAGTPDGGRG